MTAVVACAGESVVERVEVEAGDRDKAAFEAQVELEACGVDVLSETLEFEALS